MRSILLLFFLLYSISTGVCAATLETEVRSSNASLQQIVSEALTLPALSSDVERLNRQRLGSFQRQLPRLVRDIIEPYGYFYSQVSTRLQQPAVDRFRIIVDLEPGPPLLVTSMEISISGEGSEHPDLLRKLNQFPLQTNDILRQDLYEQGKAGLRQQAVSLGYLDADFTTHAILIHLDQQEAEVNLHFDTGKRYYFGETRYVEAGGYPERFLRRFVSYRRGDVFTYSLLGKTQINFSDADLFSSVSVRAQPKLAENGRIPVEVELKSLPRHRLRPGIGYGTDTGGRLSLEYRHLNLWNAAHELSGRLLFAQWWQQLEATYTIPDRRRVDSLTLLTVGTEREDVDTYYRREVFAQAEYRRSFGGGYTGSLFVRTTRERSRIGDVHQQSRFTLQGVKFGWQQIDHPLTPERGARIQLELQGADEHFFSDTSLLQLSADAALLLPLPERFSLFFRFRGGTTWHRHSFKTLPVSLRYFAGGDRSVRGYKYNSLGPVNEDGDVIGGKHLLVGSLEVERRFFKKWGAAIFYDAGNAFDSFDTYRLKQGVGFGLRYFTQIGAIRLDLARQIGERKNRLRLHLSVGLGW